MEEGAPDGLISRISLNSGDPGAMPPAGKLPQSTIDLIVKWKTDGLKE